MTVAVAAKGTGNGPGASGNCSRISEAKVHGDCPITFAGIVIPACDSVFLGLLAVHVAAGLVCVVAGAVASLSRKGPGDTYGPA
jgi:hypothetical protein